MVVLEGGTRKKMFKLWGWKAESTVHLLFSFSFKKGFWESAVQDALVPRPILLFKDGNLEQECERS